MSDSFINGVNMQMPPVKLPPINTQSKEKLEKAACEFEGLFMDIVMKSMRDTVPESDVMGDSKKVAFFQSMLDSEYAKEMSKQGKIGLANAIVRQLSPQIKAPTESSEVKK
jgi:flagellar protein FlgJ